MGVKTVAPPLPCTSVLQTWHRPRTHGIRPEPIDLWCENQGHQGEVVSNPRSTEPTHDPSLILQCYLLETA
ncbi:hypothetical protein AMEX_G5758 [Astyanax mexicanus]|uniref:Uncharacterized protein n=1 Tax=Astyanax mexicanus TaxID=7994 RepID=A0A8T2M057_ASTMX|nr:hypothetical protein AMEX_G5758 [Astyanax mexicanus]